MQTPRARGRIWFAAACLAPLMGCASKQRGGRMNLEDCRAAVATENERAATGGRERHPIVQRGQLATDILQAENRARVTFAMTKDAPDNRLVLVARIFVRPDGSVSDVQVEDSSGVKAFDEVVVAMMKTWKHLPKTVDCAPVAYDYPMKYAHKFNK